MATEQTLSKDYSKLALEQFLEEQIASGKLNPNTVSSWRAAVRKVLAALDPEADLRNTNLDEWIAEFESGDQSDLRADSLRVYGQRARIAVGEFLRWSADPTNYEAVAPRGKIKISYRPMPAAKQNKYTVEIAEAQPTETAPISSAAVRLADLGSLDMPFPLRPDFLAQVKIPRDLSKQEAERLCAFIKALAQE